MQLKHAWTTYAASDERGSSIDKDFITDEVESVMEVNPNQWDPFGMDILERKQLKYG